MRAVPLRLGVVLASCVVCSSGCKRSEPQQPLPDHIELTYKVLLNQGETLQAVPEAYPFQSGQTIRLAFRANCDSHAYVFARGSSGATRALYPSPKIDGGSNMLKAGVEHVVPSEGWFQFDATPGTEYLIVFVSLRPLDDIRGAITAGEVAAAAWERYVAPHLHRLADMPKDIHYVPDQPQSVETAPFNRVSVPVTAENDILMHEIVLTHR